QTVHYTYLHSFPTRRSSDLKDDVESESDSKRLISSIKDTVAHGRVYLGLPEFRPCHTPISSGIVFLEQWQAFFQQLFQETLPVRSEEHTSELQSPCNLVCRL